MAALEFVLALAEHLPGVADVELVTPEAGVHLPAAGDRGDLRRRRAVPVRAGEAHDPRSAHAFVRARSRRSTPNVASPFMSPERAGAPSTCSWSRAAHAPRRVPGALTFRGERARRRSARCSTRSRTGRSRHSPSRSPAGTTWPLPLYELALMSAAELAQRGRPATAFARHTRGRAARAVRRRRERRRRSLARRGGVEAHLGMHRDRGRGGELRLASGGTLRPNGSSRCPVSWDRPSRDCRATERDSSPTDAHGLVTGRDDVYAAGDATSFPVKQGGIADPAGRRRRRGRRRAARRPDPPRALPAVPARVARSPERSRASSRPARTVADATVAAPAALVAAGQDRRRLARPLPPRRGNPRTAAARRPRSPPRRARAHRSRVAAPAASSTPRTSAGVIGASRMRTPVASKNAFAIAAAIGACDGSPEPVGARSGRCTIATLHLRVILEAHDRIADPVEARDAPRVEGDRLVERPARAHDQVALELVLDARQVDGEAADLRRVQALRRDAPGAAVHLDLGDDADLRAREAADRDAAAASRPRRPRRARRRRAAASPRAARRRRARRATARRRRSPARSRRSAGGRGTGRSRPRGRARRPAARSRTSSAARRARAARTS